MILAIHNQNVTLQGVTYQFGDDYVEVSEGTTQEQAQTLYDAYQAAKTSDTARAQIELLERQQLLPRATREFMLMFMEANATPDILAVNPGYQAVKAFDLQIAALRAQL